MSMNMGLVTQGGRPRRVGIVRQPWAAPEGYRPPAGSAWIDAHQGTFPNNEWVAVDGTGWWAHRPSIDDLMKVLDAAKKSTADVVIAFITRDSA